MTSLRFAYTVLILLLAVYIVQAVKYYPLLPDTVASHFDFSGNADGWSSKSSMMTILSFVIAFSAFLFVGITIMLRYTTELINIPHKEYWLAPERKSETVETLGSYIMWMGNLTILLLVIAMNMTYEANLTDSHRLGASFKFIVVTFLLAIFANVVSMILRFRRIS